MAFFLHNLLAFLGFSKYGLVFIGTFVEGPVVILTSGFLLHVGQFHLVPLFFALVLGNFLADICWYFAGKYGADMFVRKYGKYFRITPELIAKVENHFNNHQSKIILFAKFTTSLAIPIFLAAGMMRMSLKKFSALVLGSGIIWTAVVLYIGFSFGGAYVLVPPSLKYPFLIALFIVIAVSLWYVRKYLAGKELEELNPPAH